MPLPNDVVVAIAAVCDALDRFAIEHKGTMLRIKAASLGLAVPLTDAELEHQARHCAALQAAVRRLRETLMLDAGARPT